MAKILFIAPDDEIKQSISTAISDYESYATRFNRPQEACEMTIIVGMTHMNLDIDSHNADIIVSRGALAASLRHSHRDIPIVELPITTIDVISSVREMQERFSGDGPIAVLGFGDVPYQLRVAAELCGTTLVPFDYHNDNVDVPDLTKILDEIQARGFDRVIGGVRTARLAKERGMSAVSIKSGRESIWPAITEAMHIAKIRRTERERAARFEAILNHVHEGIIATDTKNRVIQMNLSASSMLGLDLSCCGDQPIERIMPDPRVAGMLRNEGTYADELLSIGKQSLVLNKSAVRLGAETIGSLISFQKVSSLQNTEIAIRSKLHRRGLQSKYAFSDIVGESTAIAEAKRKALIFAKAPSNILITGETGTGKELFAQSIHRESEARSGPFVAVNCAAIPETLMESEFFGYDGGAFTGAAKEGKAGFFELAHEGTIFLDEISEIPLNLQGKLLRVIQETEVMRIGSGRIIPVSVRVVCAVNKDLGELVSRGAFRQDLYYRLAVLQLRLPPLRERGGDVPLLAELFIAQYAAAFRKPTPKLSAEAGRALALLPWLGNIRELGNVCEQLVVLNESGEIGAGEVESLAPNPAGNGSPEREMRGGGTADPAYGDFAEERRALERRRVLEAMEECGCNRTKAAQKLGMDRSTLWRKLKEYGIDCRTALSPRVRP